MSSKKYYVSVIFLLAVLFVGTVFMRQGLAWTNPTSNPPTASPTITTSGSNIGIGISPSYKLDVSGNARISSDLILGGDLSFGGSGTRTQTKNDAGASGGRSGFYETSAPVNYPTGASSWWHLLDVRHSNTSNNYAMQFAGSFFDQNLWFRKTNNSGSTAWQRVLTTADVMSGDNMGNHSATQNLSMNNFNLQMNSGYGMFWGGGVTAGVSADATGLRLNTASGVGNITLLSGGNVGIGTSVPGAKLEVAGQVKITGGTPGAGKVLTSDASGLASWTTPSSGMGGSGTANSIPKFTAGTTLGNSQITDNGTTVSIPNNLSVAGSGSNFGTTGAYIGTQTPTLGISELTSSNNRLPLLQFHAGGFQEAFIRLAKNTRVFEMGDSQNIGVDLALLNGAGTQNVYLSPRDISYLNGGNVGIGTTNPQAKLSVGGLGLVNYGIYGKGAASGVYGEGSTGYGVFGYATTGVGAYGSSVSYRGVTGDSSTGVGGYFTSGSGYALITGNGNVGIGTSNPASKLSVGGDGNSLYGIYSNHTNVGMYGNGGGTGLWGVGGNTGVYGNGGGTGVAGQGGTVGVSGVGTTYDFYANGAGVNYGAPSSIRWKKNMQPMSDILGKINNISTVYFDWDAAHGGQRDLGFIGEEVGAYFPEVVAWDKDAPGYVTGMDYSKMTPILLGAIKEQQKQIEQKQSLIDSLTKRIERLESLVK